MTPAAHLASLTTYPLKSGRGIAHDAWPVETWGLRDDRRWMVLEADGSMVSARKDPRLLTVTAVPHEDGLHLAAPGLPDLVVPVPRGAAYVTGEVWGAAVRGLPAGDAADAWVRGLLGRAGLRLVWCDDPGFRPVDQDFAGPGETVAYQDGFPLLLTSTASLALVQRWVDATTTERGEEPIPVTMGRFRPSVVVDGLDEPLVEQGWDRVRIGEVTFRMAKHCGRCVMTTYDPATLVKSKEPLRSIAAHNTIDGRIVFGVNLVPESTGTLRVGDEVTALG
ncbi:MOSC domain-containing protein [Arsenicicoccus sp. oral taxon 190]|uniref:MOSC domain-containing protein n=1 Tax=Arsenicicoccus sp. oral taxon 190 TaxID=1658671 RepID=UPI00067A1651|nr:MOSC N-terminal beta barrel domain-containing protein [Arsenicicoccus sp. oral taxon 190]AKT51322.1 hypothetical protein ADJ73_08295 [Arsenicicoccus sp. oral taxon 190]